MDTLTDWFWKIFTFVGIPFVIYSIHHTNEKEKQWRQLPLKAEYVFGRTDNLLAADDYYIDLTIYHSGTVPASGRYTIAASGDVRGTANEVTSEATNYLFKDVSDAAPGAANGIQARFYLSNATLKQNNLESDAIKAATKVQFRIGFAPSKTENKWDSTRWRFAVRNGAFVDLNTQKSQ